jgi:hypothetical protein
MAEQEKESKEERDEGTETYKIAQKTTGEKAPRSDLGGNLEERAGEADEDFDSTSGAGGTTAGGGTSGSTT